MTEGVGPDSKDPNTDSDQGTIAAKIDTGTEVEIKILQLLAQHSPEAIPLFLGEYIARSSTRSKRVEESRSRENTVTTVRIFCSTLLLAMLIGLAAYMVSLKFASEATAIVVSGSVAIGSVYFGRKAELPHIPLTKRLGGDGVRKERATKNGKGN